MCIRDRYETFAPELEKRELHELYYEVELPLCAVLARMEHAGMRVDANALAAFGSEMEVQLKTLEQHIYEEAGGPFNINSPKQLGEVLFERLQLPHGKKTKTGWSTNADVLEKLRWENPIVEEVLQYRQYAFVDQPVFVFLPCGSCKDVYKRQEQTRRALSEMHMPELDYFMVNCMESFSMTLDELE